MRPETSVSARGRPRNVWATDGGCGIKWQSREGRPKWKIVGRNGHRAIRPVCSWAITDSLYIRKKRRPTPKKVRMVRKKGTFICDRGLGISGSTFGTLRNPEKIAYEPGARHKPINGALSRKWMRSSGQPTPSQQERRARHAYGISIFD